MHGKTCERGVRGEEGESGSVTVAALGSHSEGQPPSYAWDVDDNGPFESSRALPSPRLASLDRAA